MKKFFGEFKEFISKGNVMDMAVGIVIGSAFTKIVTSLVNDVIMPAIGMIFGGVNFATLRYIITPADEAAGVEEAAIYYGSFIQAIVDFILVALVIFCVVKGINKMRAKAEAKKKAEEEAAAEEEAEPEPSAEEKLLTEIRDLLKKN